MYEATKGGVRLRVEQDEYMEDPRQDCEWLGTMACFHRRYVLGDNDKRLSNYGGFYPEDFLVHLLEEEIDRRGEHLYFEKPFRTIEDQLCALDDSESHMAWLMQRVRRHYIILPLYLYDHSGITMSTAPFSCPWDSGQVGWIFVSHAKAIEEMQVQELTPEVITQVEEILRDEVRVYDQYLRGDVYWFVLEELHGCDDPNCHHNVTLDSCSGFYGTDWEENGLADAVGEKYAHLVRALS